MTQAWPSGSPNASSSAITEKQRFLRACEQNHALTLKLLNAFPPDKAEFRPHPRSSSALQLAWTFILEDEFMAKALRGQKVLGSGFPPFPHSWAAGIDAFDKGFGDVVSELRDPKNSDLSGTVTYWARPMQTAEIPLTVFLGYLLDDHIHHRGQLSVYVRMVGGKVPAIYGPSADEPWFGYFPTVDDS
jgi:uncharacterized damage-inducible protein DinB